MVLSHLKNFTNSLSSLVNKPDSVSNIPSQQWSGPTAFFLLLPTLEWEYRQKEQVGHRLRAFPRPSSTQNTLHCNSQKQTAEAGQTRSHCLSLSQVEKEHSDIRMNHGHSLFSNSVAILSTHHQHLSLVPGTCPSHLFWSMSLLPCISCNGGHKQNLTSYQY